MTPKVLAQVIAKRDTVAKRGNLIISNSIGYSMDFPTDYILHRFWVQGKRLRKPRESETWDEVDAQEAWDFHSPQESRHHTQGYREGMKAMSILISFGIKGIIGLETALRVSYLTASFYPPRWVLPLMTEMELSEMAVINSSVWTWYSTSDQPAPWP